MFVYMYVHLALFFMFSSVKKNKINIQNQKTKKKLLMVGVDCIDKLFEMVTLTYFNVNIHT